MIRRNETQPLPPAAGRLLQQLKAQPAKATATGGLICVLLVLLARAAMPARSVAADLVPPVPAAPTAQESPLTPAEPGRPMPVLPLPAVRSPQAAVLDPPRDIFAADMRNFARAGARDVDAEEVSPPADPSVRLEELKRLAASFHLEGVVTGPRSAAFIDGTTLYEGRRYRGFLVRRISGQGVELERDGVRLELRMPEQ